MKTRRNKAFTVWELLALCAVLLVLVGVLLPPRHQAASPTRIKCVNNLKNIGLSFRIFTADNDGRFPWGVHLADESARTNAEIAAYFSFLTNELSTPKILLCPADERRSPTPSFANFTSKNISYFVSLSADETIPQAFLAGDRNLIVNSNVVQPGLLTLRTNDQIAWTREIHNEQGNIALGDGSVQQFSNNRIRQALRDSVLATNLLLVP